MRGETADARVWRPRVDPVSAESLLNETEIVKASNHEGRQFGRPLLRVEGRMGGVESSNKQDNGCESETGSRKLRWVEEEELKENEREAFFFTTTAATMTS